MADLQNMLWIRIFVFYLLPVTADACSLYRFCDYDTEYPPLLKIIIHPRPVSNSYMGNITVTCNIQKNPKVQDVYSYGVVMVKRRSSNETVSCAKSRHHFNVSVVITRKDFITESSVTCICFAKMETGICAKLHHKLNVLDPSPNNTPSSSGGWNDLYAIPVAILAVILIAVPIGLLYRRNSKPKLPKHDPEVDIVVPNVGSSTKPEEIMPFPTLISDEGEDDTDIIIRINDVMLLMISNSPVILGNGKFGTVVLGTVSYQNERKDEKAAVKMLKNLDNLKHRKDFEQEIQSLTRLDHPNIVRLLATYRDEQAFYIVMEYLAKGSLLNMLRVSKKHLGTLQLIMFANDVASGMDYLASKKIVHRDLAARNILIGDDDTAKISDFGLARSIEEQGEYITNEGYVPLKWVALETLEHRRCTIESDIWSYGVVLWEIFSYGEDPYHFMAAPNANVFDLRDFLKSGKRLDPPANCPTGIEMLMKNCWSPFPRERPSFTSLKESTQNMLKDLTNNQPLD